MARRRVKKRTHLGARNGARHGGSNNATVDKSPKSMVLRIGAGEVGPSVSQLVKDVRAMMEPGTASRLKERRSNRLKDYVSMAGPLGVSHLLLFSRSSSGNTNLRLALTPRGPTLHFKVEKYSLCKDVKKAMKHPKGEGKEYLTAPLLVMNNFATSNSTASTTSTKSTASTSVPKHLESLTTSIFQSLFPPISPQTTPVTSIRRVLLLDRDTSNDPTDGPNGHYTLNLRHYAISTKPTGISRGIRRLNAADRFLNGRGSGEKKKKKALPNLGRLEDVADYLLDPAAAAGFTSASESEPDTDAEVEVLETGARKVLGAKERAQRRAKDEGGRRGDGSGGVEKRAVKLVELGPRMRLRMTKVEDGVCAGKVMWHEYLTKSKAEVEEMERVWEARRREKEERQREQRENVERKRGKATEKQGGHAGNDDGDVAMDDEDWDSEDMIDGEGEGEGDDADDQTHARVAAG